MTDFMNKDFMLYNDVAKHLFHDYAEDLPIIDYHCHISPKEIYEDRRYNNISEVWLGGKNPDGSYFGDHYKWRLMRANGVDEEIVTGDKDPYVKFLEFAKMLGMAIGNPMYHWSNLELHKYFGITSPLTEDNAKEIYDKTSDMLLHDPSLSVRGIIKKSNVQYIGTTDDPADSLEYHEKLAEIKDLGFTVCPSFRPDKAVNIQRKGFKEYMEVLARSVGKESFSNISEVLDALNERIDFFKKHGCRASDHGIDYVPFKKCSLEEADRVFKKAINGEDLTRDEIDEYQTTVLLSLARKYHKEDIAMEIHYACSRDNNAKMFAKEGSDTGYDMSTKSSCYKELAEFFSELDLNNELPKTIVFSLDEADFNQISTCLGCFQSGILPGKMQLGAAWWFLDTEDGMTAQMKSLANEGLLGNFIGMLTDSRSFLSYTRHDYFRRILCNLIGQWVTEGKYPNDEKMLKKIIEGISYYNAKRYFNI